MKRRLETEEDSMREPFVLKSLKTVTWKLVMFHMEIPPCQSQLQPMQKKVMDHPLRNGEQTNTSKYTPEGRLQDKEIALWWFRMMCDWTIVRNGYGFLNPNVG